MRPALTLAVNKTIRAACALALASCIMPALADQVHLTNGDTLSGEIVQSDDRGVVLKHPVLGTIALDAKRIAKVTLDSDAEQPELQSETPNAGDERNEASVTAPNNKVTKATEKAALKAAARDRSVFQTILDDWDSRLTLGINGSQGPTDQQDYRIKLKTGFEDGRNRLAFDTSWYYATADGNQSQNQYQANLTKDWLQKDKPWFFFIKGQYKFDNNRSWENRTSAFGGGGYTLAKTDDVEVNTRLGFGGTYEYGSVNEFTPEALFGGSVIKWHLTERAAISGETIYYPSLEDTTNFRVESALEWTYKLDMADGLKLKLGLENEYDSNTPNEDTNNDLRYYGAVVLSF